MVEVAVAVGARPLVVDLDGTLINTDLLFEMANQFVVRSPLEIPLLGAWLIRGKSVLKTRLAERVNVDAAALPYNQPLLEWLLDQKASGRRLILATASPRKAADAIAGHLGLFDEVLATEEALNLRDAAKRDVLLARYGDGGFDYVGDCAADYAVWRAAEVAHIVGARASRLHNSGRISNAVQIVPHADRNTGRGLVRAMRPHQWMKNLLVFVPLLTAQHYGDLGALVQAVIAFLVFGMVASSVYILNDLVDVADDRHHVRKRSRPFATGEVSLLAGWAFWPALLAIALCLSALLLPMAFLLVLVGYFGLTLAYSLRLKQIPMVDVLALAALYTMRLVAGAAAITVALSFWLLAFSVFFFLSLAFVKRFSELRSARLADGPGKLRGRGYLKEDLELVASLGTGAGYISVLVFALYIRDEHTGMLYHTPEFIWLACPLLLFWISRAWLIAHRGDMHDDPIIFAIKDRTSWITGALLAMSFAMATIL